MNHCYVIHLAHGARTAVAGAALLLAFSGPALAQAEAGGSSDAGRSTLLGPTDLAYLAVLAIFVGAALVAAVFAARQRADAVAENEELKGRLALVRAELDDRSALLAAADERLIVFSGPGEPKVFGALAENIGAPEDPHEFRMFEGWLDPQGAEGLRSALDRLLKEAVPFRMELEAPSGDLVEACGRTRGGLAFVRFVPLAGVRETLSRLVAGERAAQATIETLQNLFDAIPMPIWLRDDKRSLVWVNRAYSEGVGAKSVDVALLEQREFLSEQDRVSIGASLTASGAFDGRLSTVVAADRRHFSVVEALGPIGSAGLAVDVSETEQVRMELKQTIDAQSDMLDQLRTAVARFDDRTRLVYYNAAMQRLFDLPSALLESQPDHLSLLDNLRTRGILPTEKYFRSEMRDEDLAAYRATEPVEKLWHLADGRHLRVIATPQPQGGATWVFEDITEKLELESQVRATVQLQRETIDYLSEAVAVFGSDGRLRLSNPAFAQMFGLQEDYLKARPRVHTFKDAATVELLPLEAGQSIGWSRFATSVTAFEETGRESETGELALSSGQIVAYGIVPLPAGQTMLTFSDVSDARKAERALREKNEALEEANQIKNDFVQHVNYELRSPLTNIIGFSALLRSAEVGPLNERQSEYLGYISTSTSSLLTIVNDILDLATIDAGIMRLEVSKVDIAGTVEHAVDGVRERLAEGDVELEVDLENAGETFEADGGRLTQILFNLLSNAANFAPSGSTVELKAERGAETIAFSVADGGPGIPPERVERLFERFESHPEGGRNSGAGLGLSIVKSFVELHYGSIRVDSAPGKGTRVTCIFPLVQGDISDPPPSNRETRPFKDAAQ